MLPAVCDHCVVLLLDDLEWAGALLPAIHEQLLGINTSSAAWSRLRALNASIADLQVPLSPAHARLPSRAAGLTFSPPQRQLQSPLGLRHETARQLETLERQISGLGQDTQRLDGQAGPWGPLPGTCLP